MGGGGGGVAGERSLKETPTWAVAVVCTVFVIVSILIEHGIHSLAKWFQKRQKKAMMEALEKIKAELMLLGFISLLLTFGTKYVAKICMDAKYGDTMLPCLKQQDTEEDESRRKLLWRRQLAAAPAAGLDYCSSKGKIPLISQSALNQLHIFIFVLAVFHILYSVITMALAQAKMKKWKTWEAETSSIEYQFSNGLPIKLHLLGVTPAGLGCRGFDGSQFYASVSKVDYITMRHGFINAHFGPDSKFDFHKYIKRSLEDDFKMVVGIRLVRAHLVVIGTASVGMKLELIIMEMAQEIQERTTVVRGAPVVEPNNKYFWFNRPQWILLLIHFTLFQNAFQIAYFLWIWEMQYEFGLRSCFHENLALTLTRVFVGIALQFICSYVTFPLYALVTQMGSHMKKAIFEEQTAKALKKWQKAAREKSKLKKGGDGDASPSISISGSGYVSGETTPSQGTSPIHLLHKYNPTTQPLSSPKSHHSSTLPSHHPPPNPNIHFSFHNP
ncbi:MLO protein-like protein 1-like [Senna tora]|uniref:MLO-like protein n=1 Tax=Senna tora TaxID=362788 RepID=A0A834U007_9FABA|nr:MLO protein-like protein 1-like [Senna tora]